MTLRLAWFATAKGTSSRLLFQRTVEAIDAGRLDARIAVVFCNRERGRYANTDAFLDAVDEAGVPAVTISSGDWRKRVQGERSTPGEGLAPWRHDYDRAVRDAIAPFQPDAGVLAGYMLITSEQLCDWLPLLNLHPAQPDGPVGTWQEVIRELIEAQSTSSGMMLQRVTTALDRGPVVTSCRYSIRGQPFDDLWSERRGPPDENEPLFAAIRAAGVKREPIFVIESLRAIADGRLTIPAPGDAGPRVNISDEVEARLAVEEADSGVHSA